MTLVDILRNALLAGFGIQEKLKEIIDDLVKKGELSESQAAKLVMEFSEKAEKSSDELAKNVSDIITKSLERMNLPTKDDIEDLNKKIKALSARVKKIEGSPERSE
jgi:polyhydroxyalkanoate synthesis regulator phasin